MNKKIFILILITFSVSGYSQLIYDNWGDIIPYSQSDKYNDQISINQINCCSLPSYDNDSLFLAHNFGKAKSEVGSAYISGISIDTTINVRELGTKVEIEEGTLWLLVIKSETAKSLNPVIDIFKIPDGAYLSFISNHIAEEEPKTFTKESIESSPRHLTSYSSTMYGNIILIEYFEPKNSINDCDINLSMIKYYFAGIEDEKYYFKSGIFSHENDPILPCQHDITCASVAGWTDEGNGVGHIRIPFEYNGNPAWSTGTFFFLNKNGDYETGDQPYFLTCGHIFYPKLPNGQDIDISQTYDYEHVKLYVDYAHKTCNSTRTEWGRSIGNATRLLLGSNYKITSMYLSEDYSFWQTDRDVDRLAKKSINYLAWSTNGFNPNNDEWASIGHPKDDVAKVLIDNDPADYTHLSGYFTLKFDLGITETGFSGAPILNDNHFANGWIVSKEYAPDCSWVGLRETWCGLIMDIHDDIAPYIDDLYAGSALSYFPEFIEADYCDNCVVDGDEEAMDCGGSCNPCGTTDNQTLTSEMQLIDNRAQSRYDLTIDPVSDNSLFTDNKSYEVSAGENILIAEGTLLPSNVEISISINQELYDEPDRRCANYCFEPSNVFTPNGDGINDFYGIEQASITKMSIVVSRWTGNWTYAHSENNIQVNSNGIVYIWDGTDVSNPPVGESVYIMEVETEDCFGTTRNHTVWPIYAYTN